MTESIEFDATLGGAEHLPFSANSLKFAASRSVEIAAMTESILRPSNTKLIFQTLPVHMRRRVMSHHCKRLPRKLRAGHMEQLKKSGLPPKQKRPCRKYRRRPANLLAEYTRRQKQNVWLETHIWHAKRFHMVNRWKHRLAYAPCDKAFRACYRATSAHCLIQDMSYYVPIKVTGSVQCIKDIFSEITSPLCGLSVVAKAYVTGKREGSIHLFKPNNYPFGYIGKISFLWETDILPHNEIKRLWLFVHPSQAEEVASILNNCISPVVETENLEVPVKRIKLDDKVNKNRIKVLSGSYNRFRLTGPNSHAVLVHALKCVDNIETIKENEWVKKCKQQLFLNEKAKYWECVRAASSPAQLPCNAVIGLTVRDPRFSRPTKRTKAKQSTPKAISTNNLINIESTNSVSPIWDANINKFIKDKMLTNTQFIEHITKSQLVPGEVFLEDPKMQSIPVVLIQRPGSNEPLHKKLGFGSGWDIIVPSGYGLPFWHTFIMFGARSGGLRETENLAFEMGETYLPPDSMAGMDEENRIESEMKDKYFRRPASKRVNYVKYGVNSPFRCQWQLLLKDWCNKEMDQFFVLRDKQLLNTLQECIEKKRNIPDYQIAETCLVPIYLQMGNKGNIKRHALICLPTPSDIQAKKTLEEPQHSDPNEEVRKQTKVEHKKNIKQLRRRRIKAKKNGNVTVSKKKVPKSKREPSEYVKKMRELWLPSKVVTVRHTNSRQLIGYLSQGAFSFTEAKGCGVGYIAYNALKELLQQRINMVLVRNTSSRKYRLANLRIVKE